MSYTPDRGYQAVTSVPPGSGIWVFVTRNLTASESAAVSLQSSP
jgi:hypothetical protein